MTNRDRSTILVVEHDDATRQFLADHLTADGFDVLVADCAREGLRRLETAFPDLAIVDVALEDHSGLDLLRHVRESDGVASRVDRDVAVVVAVAGAGELDRIRAFERGADDVVGKPFLYPELRCRVEAILRRTDRRRGAGRLRVADLHIDTASRTVYLGSERLDVSAKEFALLRVLASDPTRVFTKAELLRSIWGRTVGTNRRRTPLIQRFCPVRCGSERRAPPGRSQQASKRERSPRLTTPRPVTRGDRARTEPCPPQT